MATFIIRRLIQLIFVLWGGVTLLFLLFLALPENPAEVMAGGGNRNPDPQVVKNIEERLGLNDPFIVQYGKYLQRIVTLDFGESFKDKTPVTEIIADRLPTSLRLAFWAITIEALVGIGSGVISARRRNSAADWITTTAAVVASSIPVFVLAFMLKQFTGVYASQHGWASFLNLPTGGWGDDEWFLGVIPSWNQFTYLIQPAIILASVSTAILARLARTSLLETANADHVRTAYAKGLKERDVTRRHILRNGLIPVVTFIGIDFGVLVGSAILTETVFNIRGLGSTIATAAKAYDLPVVLGLSVVVMLIFGVASLIVDLSYAWLDPRVRLGGES